MNSNIKNKFSFFNKNKAITYLDSASTSLKLESVINSLTDYYMNNGTNIHRGVYKLAHEATSDFEETRELIAKFINSDLEEVIFTKGTTDSLNKLANSYGSFINEGDEIISSELEHHSSLLPWQVVAQKKGANLKFVPLTEEGKITVDNFKKVITNKTKVVAVTYVSNALGFETPIEEIIKIAHEHGAIVIIDAAQASSHIKMDVKKLDVDFLAFSAHKMYGPNGTGILYGKRKLLEKIPPFEFGGEMAHLVYLDNFEPKEIPYKFEAGTPVIAETIAFKEAIKFFNEVGIDNIYKHEMELKQYALAKMEKIEDITIYNKTAESPMITFNIDGIHPHDVASVLDEQNVYLRAGHHCAQLVGKFLNAQSTLRASFAIYNTYEDCDRLVDAVIMARDFFKGFGE